MRRAAMLLAIALLAGTLSGCSGGQKTAGTGTSAAAQTQTAQTEAAGKGEGDKTEPEGSKPAENIKELEVLKIGVADLPKHMDPMRDVGNVGIRIHYNIFETLILADQKNGYEQKPMLAQEWKRVDDYTVEFKLRQGVKFHNGDEMKAEDIKYSFDRLKKDIQGIELASSLMLTIKDVEVVDRKTDYGQCRPYSGRPGGLQLGFLDSSQRLSGGSRGRGICVQTCGNRPL